VSFTSIAFPLLFGITVIIFFVVPARIRWLVLLISSYYFYMSWHAAYVVLLLACTVVNYYAAIRISSSQSQSGRKRWLLTSLVLSLGLLLFYKYVAFVIQNLQWLLKPFSLPLGEWQWQFNILLPIGISFYTFQALSYTIDVYRGNQAPEKHFGKFALFVSFFPQLVAGPIEKAKHLLPQLIHTKKFNYQNASSGFQRMLLGYFKKFVIADSAAIVVNHVYGNPGAFNGPALFIATVLFAFQIYYDFSAYCDIAIGAARVLGINLIENFNRPYSARTITDFWRRWHISLMMWFREYIYIPLGGNRVSLLKHIRNILIVFLISGIWHGAAWTFIIWGIMHGIFVLVEMLIKRSGSSLPSRLRWLGVPYTFLAVTFSWIFFRAESIQDALSISKKIAYESTQWLTGSFSMNWHQITAELILDRIDLLILFSFIVLMEVGMWLKQKQYWQQLYLNNRIFRWPVLYALILCMFIFGSYENEAFIYFQF